VWEQRAAAALEQQSKIEEVFESQSKNTKKWWFLNLSISIG
jgi:hypothetical protein